MAKDILVNGQPGHTIDVTDRGLAYGHGLFETLTLNQGSVVAWDDHIRRLAEGAHRLGIPLDNDFFALLARDFNLLLSQQSSTPERQVLKIIVTRGCGGRGYAVTGDLAVNRILMLNPYPQYPGNPAEVGVKVLLCKTRLARNPQLAGIKHLNRLEQVLARSEWSEPEIREGLVCDTEGNLIEGTMSNLFWVREGKLYTPSLKHCGVNGIIRQRIIELARRSGIELTEGELSPYHLQQCDEVFVCNSVIGVWPVSCCQLNEMKQLTWPVGEVTRNIQQSLAAEGIF